MSDRLDLIKNGRTVQSAHSGDTARTIQASWTFISDPLADKRNGRSMTRRDIRRQDASPKSHQSC